MLAVAPVEDVVAEDPFLDQRRRDCVTRVRTWLKRDTGATVLSISGTQPRNRNSHPDRAYNAVADEADVYRVIGLLPPLERTACLVSKATSRDDRHWFRRAEPELRRLLGPLWAEWVFHVEEAHGVTVRPFERLLDIAAEMITDHLGAGWW